MNEFIVLGRLSEEENIVKAVSAETHEQAGLKFERFIRDEQGNHDMRHDFYIEHNTTYEQLIELSSDLVPPAELATKEQNAEIYIVMGRLCDNEDYVKAVSATDNAQANDKFEAWVRNEDDDNDLTREFYIEHSSTYAELRQHSAELLSQSTFTLYISDSSGEKLAELDATVQVPTIEIVSGMQQLAAPVITLSNQGGDFAKGMGVTGLQATAIIEKLMLAVNGYNLADGSGSTDQLLDYNWSLVQNKTLDDALPAETAASEKWDIPLREDYLEALEYPSSGMRP